MRVHLLRNVNRTCDVTQCFISFAWPGSLGEETFRPSGCEVKVETKLKNHHFFFGFHEH